jgi:hypothetical protein
MTAEWTESDFDSLSWHDNHVHGLQVRPGPFGPGQLILDLDYITEWVCDPDGSCRFRIAPATLTFREVSDLRVELDYHAVQAAITPFSISQITRESTSIPSHYQWRIEVNWPQGAISFVAAGFNQTLRGPLLLKAEQWLEPAERAGGSPTD